MADVILLLHFAFVLFIVGGFLLVWVGFLAGWSWIRNFKFRIVHILSMAFVTLESLIGMACPLTELESWLRSESNYEKGFLAYWIHRWMFYSAPEYVFISVYAAFLLLTVLTYFIVRPARHPRTL